MGEVFAKKLLWQFGKITYFCNKFKLLTSKFKKKVLGRTTNRHLHRQCIENQISTKYYNLLPIYVEVSDTDVL